MTTHRALPGLSSLVVTALCLAAPAPATAGDCGCRPLADEGQAARAGWKTDWTVQLPFDSSRFHLLHVATSADLVVAQTSDGGVHAIVAEGPGRGVVAWSRRLGEPDGEWHPASIGPAAVTVATGRSIHAVRKTDGGTLFADRVLDLVVAGPAETEGGIHVPLRGGRILRVAAEPDVQADRPVEIAADGPLSSPPFSLGQGGVGWVTDDGKLVVIQSFSGSWQRTELLLPSGPVGRPLLRGDDLFVATRGGDLLAFELSRTPPVGLRTRWRLPLPSPPEGSMVIDGGRLVVPLGVDGVAAVDADTGSLAWHAADPALRFGQTSAVVAAGGGRIWCIDAVGRLLLLDSADGSRVGCMPLCGFSLPVTSSQPGRLLLASPGGLVTSASPVGGP